MDTETHRKESDYCKDDVGLLFKGRQSNVKSSVLGPQTLGYEVTFLRTPIINSEYHATLNMSAITLFSKVVC